MLKEQTEPNLDITSALADIADVPYRDPIIDEFPEVESLDRAWSLTTEVARRAILASSDVRSTAKQFVTRPLREDLADEAVQELSARSKRINQAAHRSTALTDVLKADQVPDGLLEPDIFNARGLSSRQDIAKVLARTKRTMNREQYDDFLSLIKEEKNAGISYAERQLVAQRYRYARDVKILGLLAELYDEDPVITIDTNLLIQTLPSGTKLVMDATTFEKSPHLLQPCTWQSKKQIKDRVHLVTIDNRPYIMKERKTKRHTDTIRGGHVDGVTSQQEFEAASRFAQLGTIVEGDIQLRWEKPLGYVEFPDGYQFCLFEADGAVDAERNPKDELTNAILANPEAYLEEFAATKEAAAQLLADRADDLFYDTHFELPPAPSRFSRRRYKKNHEAIVANINQLTFPEFAAAKALSLIKQARGLISDKTAELGYSNRDHDGYSITVNTTEERVALEVISFDFEYYRKQGLTSMVKQEQFKQQALKKGYFQTSAHGERVIARAASYVLDAQNNRPIPPKS